IEGTQMANNKNQHFVPQFYLRNFSADTKRRATCLFNFGIGQSIPNASIRNQCSRDYWHGDEDPIFEDSVRGLEGLGAAAIKACILTDQLHKLRTLKTFTMFQLGRTVFSAEAFAESREKMQAKELGVVTGRSEQEALEEAYKQFEITTLHDKRRVFLRPFA